MTKTSPHPLKVSFPDADQPAIEAVQRFVDEGRYPELAIQMHKDQPKDPAEWLERIGDAEALLLSWALPDEVLLNAPNLKIVSFLGTGLTDHLNVEIARDRSIDLRRVVGYGNNAVAEHALAMLLTAWRNIPDLDRQVRLGNWPPHEAHGLQGAKVAVLGLGGIGRTFAHLASSLGMNVAGWTRSHASGERERDGIRVVSLEEALTGADAVSLHLPYLKDTHHLIGKKELNLLKPGAVLVNTARGGVIDSDALTRSLNSDHIRIAALDVFEKEPIQEGHEWLDREDVILTPHVAFNTGESFRALMQGAVDNLVDFTEGKPATA